MNIGKFTTTLRAADWWEPILPPIAAFYLLGLLHADRLRPGGWELAVLLLVMISLAVFGFFIGEWTDIRDDRLAGKANRAEGLPVWGRALVCAVALTTAVVLCRLLRLNTLQWCLVFVQALLFIVYSVPPLRLKRLPVAAALLDSLYSGTLMYLLAFSLHNAFDLRWVVPLFIWGMLRGVRNFSLHTVLDAANDRKREVRTIAGVVGPQRLLQYLRWFLLPLEAVAMYFVLVYLEFPYIGALIVLYGLTLAYGFVHRTADPDRQAAGVLFVVNLYHELVLPMAALILLALRAPNWWIGAGAFLLLFPGYRKWISAAFQKWG